MAKVARETRTGGAGTRNFWAQDEELLLAECYKQISEDPIGSEQKNKTFWYKVLDQYNEQANSNKFLFRTKMLTGKWTPMNREVGRFNLLVNETRVMSRENNDDWMTSTTSLASLTPEELKVDKIVFSWILFTLYDSLQARLVVARPKSAKEAWGLISDIIKNNKRSRTNALKAELRSIKLGDQSMESYFQKIDSIVTILTSLDACVNDEDVVHYALEAVRSLLITKEMRLKSKALALPVDSSSPMVIVAESSTNPRSFTSQGKSWKPCFHFAKGSCRFGDSCQYVHDVNARVNNANSGFNKGRSTSENTTHDLLNKLLA
ncbi:ribonuclease H-like domain-containing protein [Tanacetum coccineum]